MDGTRCARDRGSTLVEITVAIALIGTLGVAAMTLLRTSIRASSLDRDHANAHAWLQVATDLLYDQPRHDCGTIAATDEAAVFADYQAVVKSAPNPVGWPAANITVVSPVKFWKPQNDENGNGVIDSGEEDRYQDTCYDDVGANLQLVTIQVSNPEGEIVESVEIAKG